MPDEIYWFGYQCGFQDAIDGEPNSSALPADVDSECFPAWWEGYSIGYDKGFELVVL